MALSDFIPRRPGLASGEGWKEPSEAEEVGGGGGAGWLLRAPALLMSGAWPSLFLLTLGKNTFVADNRQEGVPEPPPAPGPDGWATRAPPDLCVYRYLLGQGRLFIMSTAWQGTPAGPASARAASIPGGERVMGGVGQERHREDQGSHDSGILGPGLAQRATLDSGHEVWLLFLIVPWTCCVTVGWSLNFSGL